MSFHSSLDNYFLVAPAVELYTANIFGVKSKNNIGNQTKNLIIANALTFGVTSVLKNSFKLERPDGSDRLSFPSGHTSNSFTMAAVLFKEYNNTNKVFAYSGYAFAITTATFRVLNNRHYTSDILVGAGIGILATELVYRFKPLQRWQPFKSKKNQVFVLPTYQNNTAGFVSIIQF